MGCSLMPDVNFLGGLSQLHLSSEVMHTISDLLPKSGGAAIQMEDEIAELQLLLVLE